MGDGVGWDLGDDRVLKTHLGKKIGQIGFWTQHGMEERQEQR